MDVTVLNPHSQLLYSASEGFGDKSFDITLPGVYQFCFSNELSFTAKAIDFDISFQDPDLIDSPSSAGDNLAKAKIESFEAIISKLHSDLRNMQSYQRYFKGRDARNYATVETTSSLLFWFTLIECIVVIALAFLQVYILRKFFTQSGKVRV